MLLLLKTSVGAELFAKRRKKSESWVVDENTVKTFSSISENSTSSYQSTTYQSSNYQSNYNRQSSYQNTLSKLPPPSYLKNGTHRVETLQKMNEIQVRI